MELENVPGSVPAVIEEEKVPHQSNHEAIEKQNAKGASSSELLNVNDGSVISPALKIR